MRNTRPGFVFLPVVLVFVLALALLPGVGLAQLDESLLEGFRWRSVGPVGAGGRVVDVDVVGEFPHRIFVATASGGLWRSTNQGVTWDPLFDDQTTISIGAIAVHPHNPDVIWVGTGEGNARNSVSWGDGVYKTTDGGKSWVNTGLGDSHHVGRIVIDPGDPDTVYVAAAGHFWGPNEERGLFKTTDGGASWEPSLVIDPDTGVIDVAMDPRDGATLYAAAYQVRRDGFSGGDPETMTGPGSGLYKSTDAGRTWKKLTKGLPTSELGRIGIAVSPSEPATVYAIVQTKTTVPPPRDPDDVPPPETRKTLEDGGVFRSRDRGESWEFRNSINPRPFYYSQIRADPNDADRVYVLGGQIARSENGGETFETMEINVHVDHHDLWIDPEDSDHLVLGNDGGIYFSYDRGESWDFLNQIAIAQFYAIDVDMRKPYYIYGGVQDYCSWRGPSATRNEIGIIAEDWHKVMTGDGFQVRVDPSDPDILYAEAQYGRIVRHDLRTGQNTSITPRAPAAEEDYRFNWETPIHISYHDPTTIYAAGNRLFRSRDRGALWEVASPELTTATRSRPDVKDGEPQKIASASAFAESPLDSDLLYVGTDDGHVHVTHDGGASWTETEGFPGLPGRRWVSRLVASAFERSRAYAAFDGHRNDDFAPYLFVSEDAGGSWRSITANLPEDGPMRVVREDVRNPSLLFAGTEFGAFVSIDRGESWTRLMEGMPTVAVADLVVHPRDRDLIAGTHGRSAYVLDIAPLQELTTEVLAKDLHLFTIETAVAFRYRVYSDDQFLGEKRFVASNPPYGATISYHVSANRAPTDDDKEQDEDEEVATIVVTDAEGNVVRELEGPAERGLHRVQWDLRHTPPPTDDEDGRGFRRPPRGRLAEPGRYRVSVELRGLRETTSLEVEPDPELVVAEAERRLRVETLTRLVDAYTGAFETDAGASALHEDLKALSEREGLPDAVQERVEEARERARALAHGTGRTKTLLAGLYRAVEDSPYRPTDTQLRETDELLERHAEDVSRLDAFVTTEIAELERLLEENGVPRIRVPEAGGAP